VRPMLSIRATSMTDTRMGFDSMNSLHFCADAFLSEPRPTREHGRPGPPRTAAAILGT
jgi:hypothetical protein